MAFRSLCIPAVLLLPAISHAQYTPPDNAALQGIIVEKYYVADANDATDTDGGTNVTPGTTTYRIYVDLKPGYDLETVYGDATHQLLLSSTSNFLNNTDRGEVSGDLIPTNRLDENTVALDSWLSMGAASDSHWGVLKSEDTDGSIVGGTNNDGGSENITGGLLANNDASAGIPLTEADGLLAGTVPAVVTIGVDMAIFADTPGNLFSTTDGAWAILGGTLGPTPENRILIAQITTGGTFCFELNMRVGIPDSLVCTQPDCHTFIDYYAHINEADTAGGGVITDNRFSIPSLVYCSTSQTDCLGVEGGTALPGTACDDDDPGTGSDTWSVDCMCAGLLIDCAGVAGGPALPGTPCDDGDPDSAGDVYLEDCACEGIVGMDEQQHNGLFSATPNPTSGLLYIQAGNAGSGITNYRLYDMTGRMMTIEHPATAVGAHAFPLDLSGMPSGVYVLEVVVDDQPGVVRVVKR